MDGFTACPEVYLSHSSTATKAKNQKKAFPNWKGFLNNGAEGGT
jgi:hypothetical protein